jgi:hypothetical protein
MRKMRLQKQREDQRKSKMTKMKERSEKVYLVEQLKNRPNSTTEGLRKRAESLACYFREIYKEKMKCVIL